MKPSADSKYEHLKALTPVDECAGREPTESVQTISNAAEDLHSGGSSKPKIWKTRRRDGKIFLAAEYEDKIKITDDAKETLLRLLNHPNLIRLIDLVQGSSENPEAKDYTVWEECDRGNLNRLLWHEPNEAQIKIPESLCWHILDGISQALLWLHLGIKQTFPFDQHLEHDDDWHPVMMLSITPSNIYFMAAQGNETYGDVKLGCFASASVKLSAVFNFTLRPPQIAANGDYIPHEIEWNTHAFSPKSEVWSLGAVLHRMMTGKPPARKKSTRELREAVDDDELLASSLPSEYSRDLRLLVSSMLRVHQDARPSTEVLSLAVNRGFNTWIETTDEGQWFVKKGWHAPSHLEQETWLRDPMVELAGNDSLCDLDVAGV